MRSTTLDNFSCFDGRTGKVLWRREAKKVRTEGRNALNDAASPTPATDGQRVFSFFPELGLIAHSIDGQELWRTALGPFLSEHGLSVSPVVADRWLLLQIDQIEGSYIAGFDKHTGELVWKKERPDAGGAYSTPIVYRPRLGPLQVVTSGPFQLVGYSVETGERLWWAEVLGYQPKSVPLVEGDTFFVNVPGFAGTAPSFESVDANSDGAVTADEFAFLENPGTVVLADRDGDGVVSASDWEKVMAMARPGRGGMIAITIGGRGNVTEDRVLWREKRSLPDVPSPLLYKGSLYLTRDGGIVTTLDALNGTVQKRGRLTGAIDTYYASPVAADDKVFALSLSCTVSVLRANPNWEILAVNEIDGECYATPAIADGTIYVRTTSRLYAFSTRQ